MQDLREKSKTDAFSRDIIISTFNEPDNETLVLVAHYSLKQFVNRLCKKINPFEILVAKSNFSEFINTL